VTHFTPDQIIKFDRRTGSTHMTNLEQWGELMAEQINDLLKPEPEPHDCPTGDHDDCTPMIVMELAAPPPREREAGKC